MFFSSMPEDSANRLRSMLSHLRQLKAGKKPVKEEKIQRLLDDLVDDAAEGSQEAVANGEAEDMEADG